MIGKVHSVHDRFMKSMLGNIEIARQYFDAFLPDHLKELIDLQGLEHTSHSYVSEELQETLADIVFKCPIKFSHSSRTLYLSLLFEHKSTPYTYIAVQIGGYLYDAYREQVKNKTDLLIPVIPFLYYHGKTTWTPQNLIQLFDNYPPVISEFIPDFKYLFENIQDYTDEQILQLGEGLLTSSLLIQKYAHDPEKLIEKFHSIFAILKSWGIRNQFHPLIVYYFQMIEVDKKEFSKLIIQIPEIMTEFTSLADKLKQEGLLKGKEIKNRVATENMLRKGFEVQVICDILDVTPDFVEEIRLAISPRGK